MPLIFKEEQKCFRLFSFTCEQIFASQGVWGTPILFFLKIASMFCILCRFFVYLFLFLLFSYRSIMSQFSPSDQWSKEYLSLCRKRLCLRHPAPAIVFSYYTLTINFLCSLKSAYIPIVGGVKTTRAILNLDTATESPNSHHNCGHVTLSKSEW